MAYASAGRAAVLGAEARRYERHCPEQTLLYQLVEQHYPAFVAALAAEGREVPGYVAREFEEYVRCGRLEHGFLRVRCEVCHQERLVACMAHIPVRHPPGSLRLCKSAVLPICQL